MPPRGFRAQNFNPCYTETCSTCGPAVCSFARAYPPRLRPDDPTSACQLSPLFISPAVEESHVTPEEVGEEVAEPKERYPFTAEEGLKIYCIKGTKFELPEKYTVTARLGQGIVVPAVSYPALCVYLDSSPTGTAALRQPLL